jgi:hypothetical protein
MIRRLRERHVADEAVGLCIRLKRINPLIPFFAPSKYYNHTIESLRGNFAINHKDLILRITLLEKGIGNRPPLR